MGTSEDHEDTPLHEAVRYSDEEEVSSALKTGHDPNQIGLYQWSALHEAAHIGDLPILKLLLKFGGDPNKADLLRARTALHYAASEGHEQCLQALLDAGALWAVPDQDGKTTLDVATGNCITKLRNLSTETTNECLLDLDEVSLASVESLESSLSPSSGSSRRSPQAWSSDEPVLGISRGLVLGQIQLSFEYNSKKATFKIRVWQITDLLLPPVETSMISTIYIRSYLLPDKRKETKRKTDEQPAYKHSEKLQKKVDLTSRSMILKPSLFQFTKCPDYEKVTREMVRERTVYLEVRIQQKYTRRSFVLATWNMPMAEAVKRLVKQSYPLTPHISPELPENMKVYDGGQLTVTSNIRPYSSHPNTRVPSMSSLQQMLHSNTTDRAASDTDIKNIAVDVNMKKTASIEISVPGDDSQDEMEHALQQITIMERAEHDQWTSIPMAALGVNNVDVNSHKMGTHDVHNVAIHTPSRATIDEEIRNQSYSNPVFNWKTTKAGPYNGPHSVHNTKKKQKFSLKMLRERTVSNGDKKEKAKKVANKILTAECSPRSDSLIWQWDNYMEPLQTKIEPVTLDDDFGFELDGPYLPMVTTLDMPRVHGNSFSKGKDQVETTVLKGSTSFTTQSKPPQVVINPPTCEMSQARGRNMYGARSTSVVNPPECSIASQVTEDGATSTTVDIPEEVSFHVEDDLPVLKSPRRVKQGVCSRVRQNCPVNTSQQGVREILKEGSEWRSPHSGIELASYPTLALPSLHIMKPSQWDLGVSAPEELGDIETILI